MEMSERTKQLWGIDHGERVLVHEGSDGSEVMIVPGEKVDKYGEYDIQIRVKGGRGYEDRNPPAHPDVFQDLHTKQTSAPETAEELFGVISEVYRGADPNEFTDSLSSMSFAKDIFPADVTVALLQTMMIEQEINYGPGGEWTRYEPPRDLLMSACAGFARAITRISTKLSAPDIAARRRTSTS